MVSESDKLAAEAILAELPGDTTQGGSLDMVLIQTLVHQNYLQAMILVELRKQHPPRATAAALDSTSSQVSELDLLCAVDFAAEENAGKLHLNPKFQSMLYDCIAKGWVQAYTGYELTAEGRKTLWEKGL